MKAFLLALSVCLTLPLMAAEAAEIPPELAAKTNAALARPDLVDYRGWLKYLRGVAQSALERQRPESNAAVQRLAEWVDRISADPATLSKLTGVQEWAYESPVDGSGQPFKIVIPSDYATVKPAALSVYMHGYAGNHLEHSAGFAPQPGIFLVAVLGRSRGGFYTALSGADVLQVIDYVTAHWRIDPDRIHLNGGSMGGGGTYRFGSRYPQRWASGQPTCGFASFVPVGNLLTFPIYATHSDDDPVVSVLHDRGPLRRLREMGGQVIYDETTGLGHAAWNYTAGNARGSAWAPLQVRPASTSIRHIDYTALEAAAARGWWAEVAEWGPAPRPAHFVLQVGAANTVFAQLTNIDRLKLFIAESPLDRSQPLHVSVNGAVPITLPAPIPEAVYLNRRDGSWSLDASIAPPPFRLHAPGGAVALYDGEPLLIVYGTGGSPAEQAAMKAAAVSASHSSNPRWIADGGDAGPDGVPHFHNLYGSLNTKRDTEVTADDIARCHLVLIGTAAQNRVVARIAGRLPVQIDGAQVRTSDGAIYPFAENTAGLVYYNPDAPARLIFWVAGSSADAYKPGAFIPELMANQMAGAVCGADFVVMRTATPTLVCARGFDSRWNWVAPQRASELLPETAGAAAGMESLVADAVCRGADADVAIVDRSGRLACPDVVPGVTRKADVQSLYYFVPIGVGDLTGADLIALNEKLQHNADATLVVLGRGGRLPTLQPDRRYRVALPTDVLWSYSGLTRALPSDYRIIDTTMYDALSR